MAGTYLGKGVNGVLVVDCSAKLRIGTHHSLAEGYEGTFMGGDGESSKSLDKGLNQSIGW